MLFSSSLWYRYPWCLIFHSTSLLKPCGYLRPPTASYLSVKSGRILLSKPGIWVFSFNRVLRTFFLVALLPLGGPPLLHELLVLVHRQCSAQSMETTTNTGVARPPRPALSHLLRKTISTQGVLRASYSPLLPLSVLAPVFAPAVWLMKCPDIQNNNEGTILVGPISSGGPSPDFCDRS